MRKTFILFALLVFFTGCISSPEPTGLSENEVVKSKNIEDSEKKSSKNLVKEIEFKVETVAGNLEVPWAFAFLPGGEEKLNMLFTERPGRVRLIENGNLQNEPVYTVPDLEPSGESGLMDISLHPDFKSNKFVYLAYAYNEGGKFVKVVRYKFDGKILKEDKIIIEKIPAARFHAGIRADFGPDGKLYITTGDATKKDLAQQTNSLAGKTLRLNDDGTVPRDNPFIGKEGFLPEIWTIGHRNAQGVAWQPGTNLMFQTEHGPSGFDGPGGGDEVNIVEAGKNYGWAEIHHNQTREEMESPLLEYTPACAPASAAFYTGDKFPGFKGDLFFGCLVGVRMIRVKLNGRKVVGQENLLEKNFGRIREVAVGPDGFIYFSTSNRDGRGNPAANDDRILRLVPVE